MIVVAGTVDFADRESRDGAVEASRSLQLATREDEAGCLAYCFAADPCVDVRVQVHEVWTDEQSLAAHFEHRNYLDMRDLLGSFGLTGADTKKYRCDLAEPVYDDSFTPRADFFTDDG